MKSMARAEALLRERRREKKNLARFNTGDALHYMAPIPIAIVPSDTGKRSPDLVICAPYLNILTFVV